MTRLTLAAMCAAVLIVPGAAQAAGPWSDGAGFDWTGFYLGINGGYGAGHVGIVTESANGALDGLTMDFDTAGALLGGTVGASLQRGPLVVGVEGDLDWSGITGDADPLAFGGAPAILTARIDWMGTLRGRIGVASDRVLFYATGGVAAGGISGVVTNFPHDGTTTRSRGTQFGYAAGGGIEASLTDAISIKAEYLYLDFGTTGYALAPSDPVMALTANTHPTASVIRLGLNYRF